MWLCVSAHVLLTAQLLRSPVPSCVVVQMLHVVDYLEEKEQICPCRDSELCLQLSSVDKGHKFS